MKRLFLFTIILFININLTLASADVPKCNAKVFNNITVLKQIVSPKEIVKVSQGLLTKGKSPIGYIVYETNECTPKFIMNNGTELSDISGYSPTGAEPCSTNETFMKSEQIIINANQKLNNWVPEGNAFNNRAHFEKKWNNAGKVCSDLSKSKIGGCTGSCRSMMDDPSFHGKADFCKLVKKVDTACYNGCCK